MPNTREAEKVPHERFKHRRIPQSEYFRLTAEETEEGRYPSGLYEGKNL